ILFLYAVSGLVELTMKKRHAQTRLRGGLIWYLVTSPRFSLAMGGPAAMGSLLALRAQQPEAYEQMREALAELRSSADEESRVMASGSYLEIVAWRAREESLGLVTEVPFFALLETIPLILIGMAMYRLGLFERRFD